MNPNDDVLKGLFEKFLGTPRVIDRIIRYKPAESGVVFRDATVTGLHQGALRTTHVTEKGVLSCGCIAWPENECGITDETFQEAHLVCADCVFVCSSCSRGRCRSHGREMDGQLVCSACIERARPFLFFKNLFSAIEGLLG